MKVVIPQWMGEVNPGSYVSVRDLAQITGLSRANITALAREGKFPAPDGKTKGFSLHRNPAFLWKISTIIKYLSEQK